MRRLRSFAGLWTGEPFSFRGEHFTVDEVTFLPRPVQQPRPPIWIGAATRTAGRSSARCAGTAHASTTRSAGRYRSRVLG
jgi:alkanesulfonate monooxygenase SsuD/methylene tetrahydromethanopterin reductase-like flavin-dependent oxidoreductase (luciferase family)